MVELNHTPNTLPDRHVLVVDDDDRLRSLLQQYLSEQGFFVSEAQNTVEAEQIMNVFALDAVVLDVMMPGETGIEFARRMQQIGLRTPLLMLTALGEADDRIAGLEAGATDYLSKPFAPRELVLRLQNLLKNTATTVSKTIQFGEYKFDVKAGRLYQNGQPIYLTGSELDCLKILAEQAGNPVPRAEIAQILGDVGNERSVDVQINRLRKKLEPNPAKPIYIQTIRHAGYALIGEAK
jgi:two-component system phosphate regulon response regulator OmpR